MRNTFTNSSIANVNSRFSAKATVMLRDGNTRPVSTSPLHMAGPNFGWGRASTLEPAVLGDEPGHGLSGNRFAGIGAHCVQAIGCCLSGIQQTYSLILQSIQPASRQLLFQRMS